MKELLARPGFLGTYGTLGADLTFVLAVTFTALFLLAWRAASKHRGNAHHFTILWAMAIMLVYFLSYYLIRELGVLAIQGKEGFGGPDWFYAYVFTPVLTAHLFLVSAGLVMAIYMIVLGFRASFKDNGKRLLKGNKLRVKSKNFYMALLGTLVAISLLAAIRCDTLRCASVYGAAMALVVMAFSFEKLAERVLPYAGGRHRAIGRFTMVVFLAILFTSALTYLSLYALYPPRLS